MLACQRHLFDIPEEICYLNTAYMSPQLKLVSEVGVEAVQQKGRPWKITVEDFYQPVQRLKSLFNTVIDGEDPNRIALMPSVSYGMATVARNLSLKSGDEILLLQEQFPSNVLTWQRLAQDTEASLITLDPPAKGPNRSQAWNQRILDAINPRTRLVAMGHIHWADGTLFNLEAIREATQHYQALLVIDGTQSVGALPFSVRKIQPDALICGGYKWLMGPYSLSLGYFGPAFDAGIPIEENWYNRLDSHNFGGLVNYQPLYGPLAQRYSVGESSNFVLVPMLTAALQQILEWGVEEIAMYSKFITHEFHKLALKSGFELTESIEKSHHLLGVLLPEALDLQHLNATLRANEIYVSIRGRAMRISAHVYNRPKDFMKLLEILNKEIKMPVR